jgi:putative ABC transport system permease protein
MKSLFRAFAAYHRRKPLLTAICLVGVALGVTVVSGISLANRSALDSFRRAAAALGGGATHTVTTPGGRLPESVYVDLVRRFPALVAAPVVTTDLELAHGRATLMGVDPLAETRRRPELRPVLDADTLLEFLRRPQTVVVNRPAAKLADATGRLHLKLPFTGGKALELEILGTIDGAAYDLAEPLIMGDISWVQELVTGRGVISRIDLDLARTPASRIGFDDHAADTGGQTGTAPSPTGTICARQNTAAAKAANAENSVNHQRTAADAAAGVEATTETETGTAALTAAIRRHLPPGVELSPAARRDRVFDAMLRSFELNITALSLLSLFVGFFLIYNTVVFMVLQRRRDFGILLTLGYSHPQLTLALLLEVIVLAAAGSLLGLLWGWLLATHSITVISRTISDLYFFLQPGPVWPDIAFIRRGLAVGIGAGLCGAALPALELHQSTIVRLLSRRAVEDRAFRARYRIAGGGVIVCLLSVAVSLIPGKTPYFGFAGAFGVCLGFALMTPLFVDRLIAACLALGSRRLSIKQKLALSAVTRRLSRTAPAIAALMVALAMSLGISLMIGSFRATLADWFVTNIQGDFYVSGGDKDYGANTLAPGIRQAVAARPEVAAMNRYRNLRYRYGDHIIRLSGIDAEVMKHHSRYQFIDRQEVNPWDALAAGKIMVTESFARKFDVGPGDTLTLGGFHGEECFEITAVYRDYITEHGIVAMDYATFSRFMHDNEVNSLALFLRPDTDRQAFRRVLADITAGTGHRLYANGELRQRIMDIFDRSFAITISTRFIAVLVAFFGIVSALLSIYLESEREYGILRALGLSRGEIFRLSLTQSAGMGLLAALLAGACGPALAWILIKVINLKSFNWTIDMHVTPGIFIATLGIAVGAALVSGLYPAWRIARSRPSFQMREV